MIHAINVLASLAVLPSIVFADVTVPPGLFPHADAVRTLAETFAVALVASARCPDLFVSTDLDGLQAKLGLPNSASPEAFDLQVKLVERMNQEADKIGARAWCDDAYGRFGPSGSMMTGLLKRCDAGSAGC